MCALLFAASVAGCGDTTPTGPYYDVDELRAALTPEVAASLDADGRLPVAQGAPGLTEITGARAAELALAYWRIVQPWRREALKAMRPDGYAKEPELCGPSYYSAAAYETPFDAEIEEIYHLWMGPFWLVPLCDAGRQQAVIAFSARATHVEVVGDSELRGRYWDQTFVRGLRDGAVPLSPEAGAVAIMRAFGVRVSAVPDLRKRPGWDGEAAFGSTWHYRLEHPVVVMGRESAYPREVQELVVGFEHSGFWGLDYLVNTERTYILVDNPWYANESRVQPMTHWDEAAGRCCDETNIMRRTDVAPHYEVVRAIPRR